MLSMGHASCRVDLVLASCSLMSFNTLSFGPFASSLGTSRHRRARCVVVEPVSLSFGLCVVVGFTCGRVGVIWRGCVVGPNFSVMELEA